MAATPPPPDAFAFSPDGELFAAVSDRRIQVWSTRGGQKIAGWTDPIADQDDSYSCIACSSVWKKQKNDGDLIVVAVGTANGEVLALDSTGVIWKNACHTGLDTVKEGTPEYNLDEPTMEQKLESLNLLNKSEFLEEQSTSLAPPSADSVYILLKQALRADDHTELVKCLYNRDEKVIVKSVSLLTPGDALKLLKFFVSSIQSRGAKLVCLLPWLQTLLSRHMSSIVSQESSLLLLNSLYQLIDARTSTFKSALQLSTTLDYRFSEIADEETDKEEAVAPIIYEDKDTDDEESEIDAMETDGESEELGDVTDALKHSDGNDIMSD
ncbi:WD repeat-containing protein 43 [Hordeum vulgare]|nr:WD repeat-containing protein 43 [Hordeum vulgare]